MTLTHWLPLALLALPCVAMLAAPFLARRFMTAVPHLKDLDLPEPARWPRVSVIVPARDEGAHARTAGEARLAVDYPDLQVVLVDDRSSDETGAVFDELAADDPRVTAVHVTELPADWLGKNHALQQGVDVADGEWLLFTDADVHMEPAVIRKAIAFAEREQLDMLALLPEIWSNTFALDAALAAFGRMFTLTQRPWAVRDPRSKAAIGVGAFNLVRREAFQRTEGFEWLKYDVVDDLALGLMMKRSGARCAAASGKGLLGLSWYETLPEMVVGLEKNTYASAGCSALQLVFGALFMVWADLAPFVALSVSAPAWLPWLAGTSLAVMLACAVVMARWMKRPVLPSLVTPLGTLAFVTILLRAAWLGARRGGVIWRGTFYPARLLRERARVRIP